MDDQDFKELYGISEREKTELINRISQDISLIQDFEIENGTDLGDGELDLDDLDLDSEVDDDTY